MVRRAKSIVAVVGAIAGILTVMTGQAHIGDTVSLAISGAAIPFV